MRLLYGVQATGNGHISRARALRYHLAKAGCQIDFIFSGRPADRLFDMAEFGQYQVKRGLSFVSQAGQLQLWQTARQADLPQLWRDIQQLNTRRYDLVLTDYEPITAWAARRQGTPVLALGHQYGLHQPVPLDGFGWWQRRLLANFAPARQQIGLHWHHFDSVASDRRVILPPVVHLLAESDSALAQQADDCAHQADFVLVYLPFESADDIRRWLAPLSHWQFKVYGVGALDSALSHVSFMPASVQHFQRDLRRCQAVISNAGFELISESLQLKKKVLVKPLQGQPEQAANASALRRLRLADSCNELDATVIGQFLRHYQSGAQVQYPDVAAAISHWLLAGQWFDVSPLAALWQQTQFSPAAPLQPAAQLPAIAQVQQKSA
jgi:uncharacterized protein (TIGR00661 family)